MASIHNGNKLPHINETLSKIVRDFSGNYILHFSGGKFVVAHGYEEEIPKWAYTCTEENLIELGICNDPKYDQLSKLDNCKIKYYLENHKVVNPCDTTKEITIPYIYRYVIRKNPLEIFERDTFQVTNKLDLLNPPISN